MQRHPMVGCSLTSLLLLVAGALGTGGAPGPAAASPAADHSKLMNTGVGMYTDASVANQVSSFTINPLMVSCGVGTLAPGGEFSGPFAMLMYATRMDDYRVDPDTGEIHARGRMRSITKTNNTVMEDAEHDFIAIASDSVAHGGFEQAAHAGGDRFDVHFQTPFWDGFNPMCTRSDKVDGGCRFGGELLMGDILIGG